MKLWTKGLLFTAILAGLSACGSRPHAASAVTASPQPPVVPFATVAPIIAAHCAPCHSGTFVDNQDQVYAARGAIADKLSKKLMPPPYAATQLGDADRSLLVQYMQQFP